MSESLPEAARAFVEGDVTLLPTALADDEIEQLVAFLVERGDAERLARLGGSLDKRMAKPARRGLHLLRARGQSTPEPAKREFVLPGPYATSAEPDGLVSYIDGRGERVVWLVRSSQEGVDVYQVELSEARGIIGFQIGSAPKKEWRAHVESVTNDKERVVARVPFAHVRWLIEEGYEQTVAAGRTPPEDFARSRLSLGVAERPGEHPALKLAPPLGYDDARPRLAALHRLPEMALWVPPAGPLDELDAELGKIAESKLELSRADREQQMALVIDRLADQATAVDRQQLAARLDETALMFVARQKRDEARLCTTAAAMLRDANEAGAANPFLRQLFEKLIKPEEVNK